MPDFNLIPADYVADLVKRRLLVRALALIVLVVLLCSLLAGLASKIVVADETALAQMRDERAVSVAAQERLMQLKAEQESLLSKRLLLESLRSGANMVELVSTIEQAVRGTEVWFVNWQFLRAGIVVDDDPAIRAPSYFVLTQNTESFPDTWHHLTRMTIQGEARDHAALSQFVQNLFTQAIVDDVRVQRSAQEHQRVTFNLAVVVKTARGNS